MQTTDQSIRHELMRQNVPHIESRAFTRKYIYHLYFAVWSTAELAQMVAKMHPNENTILYWIISVTLNITLPRIRDAKHIHIHIAQLQRSVE